MCSIISFENVRMSGMSKNMVTSYAALGVGLAIVLTFGLTAISSVVDQRMVKELVTSQPESIETAPAPSFTEESSQTSEMQDVGGGTAGEVMIQKAPAREEEMVTESYSIAAEVPSPSPFAGLLIVLPYIAAAAVGSVVFIVTRKRVLFTFKSL